MTCAWDYQIGMEDDYRALSTTRDPWNANGTCRCSIAHPMIWISDISGDHPAMTMVALALLSSFLLVATSFNLWSLFSRAMEMIGSWFEWNGASPWYLRRLESWHGRKFDWQEKLQDDRDASARRLVSPLKFDPFLGSQNVDLTHDQLGSCSKHCMPAVLDGI